MPKLPVLSGSDVVKALTRIGFSIDHQTGSHMILRKENPALTVSVPNHKELKTGTLRSIIKQARLTIDEFTRLL